MWAYDFVAERTHDGRPLKILTGVGGDTRADGGGTSRRQATVAPVLAAAAARSAPRVARAVPSVGDALASPRPAGAP